MTLSENLDTFLADFGVSVVIGATQGVGVLDMPDVLVGDGMSISTDYSLTCKASVFGSTAHGTAATVDGVAYTVRKVEKIDDGKFCRLLLSKT